MPLDDRTYGDSAAEADSGEFNRFAPAMENRPVIPLPDRPGRPIPDRPASPGPGRPTPPMRPNPPGRPNRPTPPGRPLPPPRPGTPVRPDWSWNWGLLLPGTVFPASIARVRFYNAAIRTPIQIYINNRLVVSNLNFMEFTRFYNVVPGRYRITIYRGNDLRSPVIDTWMSFPGNRSTTVTVVGSNNNFWIQTSIS